MTSITKIAKSTISRSTARITTATFNKTLFLANAASELDGADYYEISDVSELADIDAGLDSTHAVYQAAAAYFSGTNSPDTLIIGQETAADGTAGDAVTRILNAGANPYFVAAQAITSAEHVGILAALSGRRAFGAFISTSTVAVGTPSADSVAETMNNDRGLYIYEPDANNTRSYNEMRLLGYAAASQTGSWVAASQLLNGAQALELTDSEYSNAIANRMNTFTNFGGNVVLQDGQTSSGEWMDVIINLDWVDARIEEELALLKIKLGKVAYTEAGVSLEKLAIMGVLGKAQDLGIFSSFTVTSQSAASQGASTRATRQYAGHSWVAQLEGAIQYTEVKGNVGA